MGFLRPISRKIEASINKRRFRIPLRNKIHRVLQVSQLFDGKYYAWKNNIIDLNQEQAIKHYLAVGWKKGLDPHPLFRTDFYLSQVGKIGRPALLHYLQDGYKMGHSPHPLFDTDYYYSQRPDVKQKNCEPIRHYLEHGSKEGSRASPFFDESYYQKQYPYIASAGMNPLVHYVMHGEGEFLNPSNSFQTKAYLIANPDVGASSIGALEHYILHGIDENRPMRPVRFNKQKGEKSASISVVIPTYNRANLLKDTIELCQEHSYECDIEFIIINDGSKDHTIDVLQELSDTYDNVVCKTVDNGGPGSARNLGASLANKEIILFLGDDIQPTNADFFKTHARLHATYNSSRFAVLGKCIWPNNNKIDVNHVMRHIQGRGGEQFGYSDFTPYTFLDWRFFYTANVSVKRELVADWSKSGFSPKFNLYGFEDTELAYRLSQEEGGFTIFYDPTSLGLHIHPYTVDGFIKRQFNTGMMAEVFIKLHDVVDILGLRAISNKLKAPPTLQDPLVSADCLSILEGIKAWARFLDRNGGLGREAWHDDLLFALFEASYLQGYVAAQQRFDANIASAYQYILSNFIIRMRRSIHHELSAAEFIQASLFDPITASSTN